MNKHSFDEIATSLVFVKKSSSRAPSPSVFSRIGLDRPDNGCEPLILSSTQQRVTNKLLSAEKFAHASGDVKLLSASDSRVFVVFLSSCESLLNLSRAYRI